MDRVGSNLGGGGQLSLLGHEHVPSSFGEQGSKSKCSSFNAAAGFWFTCATGMLLDLKSSAEPTAGNFSLIIPSFPQVSLDNSILSTPSAT